MWPTPQDYNEAIQSPMLCFADADLCGGKVELNAIGVPKVASGTFASVYKLSQEDRAWAVRCFLQFRDDQDDRYQKISDFILFDINSSPSSYQLFRGNRVRQIRSC
jgi:hypothetical protein